MNKKCVKRKKKKRAERRLRLLLGARLSKYIGMEKNDETEELIFNECKKIMDDLAFAYDATAPKVTMTINVK